MNIQFTKNVAINTENSLNNELAQFYGSLGLETKQFATDFTVLGTSPYSCYVVSWSPPPKDKGEICLQFETDDIHAAKKLIESKGCEIVCFGDDPNSKGKTHLWFRDPVGNLINIIEMQ